MKEHERIILKKMKAYAVQALHFKGSMEFCAFSEDAKTIAACVLVLSQIGELVGRLSEEFTNRNSQIPWRKIKGMRNRIVHDYEGIRLNIVWDVLTDFLPAFIETVDTLL